MTRFVSEGQAGTQGGAGKDVKGYLAPTKKIVREETRIVEGKEEAFHKLSKSSMKEGKKSFCDLLGS